MKINQIISNLVLSWIKSENNNVFGYGSNELAMLIKNQTSSSVYGGDVDFCNVIKGMWLSNQSLKYLEIKKDNEN